MVKIVKKKKVLSVIRRFFPFKVQSHLLFNRYSLGITTGQARS